MDCDWRGLEESRGCTRATRNSHPRCQAPAVSQPQRRTCAKDSNAPLPNNYTECGMPQCLVLVEIQCGFCDCDFRVLSASFVHSSWPPRAGRVCRGCWLRHWFVVAVATSTPNTTAVPSSEQSRRTLRSENMLVCLGTAGTLAGDNLIAPPVSHSEHKPGNAFFPLSPLLRSSHRESRSTIADSNYGYTCDGCTRGG